MKPRRSSSQNDGNRGPVDREPAANPSAAQREHSREHSIDLELARDEALDWLEQLVATWAGDLRRVDAHEAEASDAKLVLPVQAGLREGALLVDVTALALGDGSRTRLLFRVERSEYRLRRASLLILTGGLLSAVLIVLMPLIPRLVGLLPMAFAFMILAWFLVLARVRYRGLPEFVAKFAEDVSKQA